LHRVAADRRVAPVLPDLLQRRRRVLEARRVDEREEDFSLDFDRISPRLPGRARLVADRDALLFGERRDDAGLALIDAAAAHELGRAHSGSTRARRATFGSSRLQRSRIFARRGSSARDGPWSATTTSRSPTPWKRRSWPLVGSSHAE